MMFDQQLYNGPNLLVRHAISSGGPILEKNGGSIGLEQLEDYLDIFESVANADEHDLIDEDMLYFYHSYYMEEAYQNKEVQNFISDRRKEDPDYYLGFEGLAKRFLKRDSRIP